MPAPRPVSVSYMDPGSVGLLSLRAGEGMLRDRLSSEAQGVIDSTRRYQLQRDEMRSRERMFALEQAYQNRAGSGQERQQNVQPAATRQQQLDDTLRQMVGQGSIDPDQAGWLKLSALGVDQDPVNQALGVQTGSQQQGGLTPYQQQMMQYRQQDDARQSQVKSLEEQIEQAEQQVKAYESSIPGGAAGMSSEERRKYDQLTQMLNQRRSSLSSLYEQFGQGGAPAGGGGAAAGMQGGSSAGGGSMTFEQAEQAGNVAQDANGRMVYWNGVAWVPKE